MPMLSDIFAFGLPSEGTNQWSVSSQGKTAGNLPKIHGFENELHSAKHIELKPKNSSTTKCYQLAICLIMHDGAGTDGI